MDASGNADVRTDGTSIQSCLKDGNLVEEKYRRRNLVTGISLMGIVMVAEMIYYDTYSQWLYYRYTEQVLGANYSHLNVSAIQHPCLRSNSSVENKYSKQLNEAQKLSSDFNSYTSLLSIVPALLSNIMFGAYTDYIGRKLYFIVPISGLIFKYILTWAVNFWHLNLYLILIAYFIQGLTGSLGTLFMALFTYTADNTDENKGRSLEMVLVESVSIAMSSLSHMAVGYAIAYVGYMWPMVAACVLGLFGLMGYIFILRETLPRRRDMPCISILQGVKSIFSFYFIKSTNPMVKRKNFIILVAVFALYAISIGPSIQYLYLLDQPLCWNSKMIGVLITVVGILQCICALIMVKILKKFVSDDMVLLINILFSVAYRLTLSMATTNWMVYLAYSFSLLQGYPLSIARAIVSHWVPPTKRGSLFSSIAVLETLFITGSSIPLNALYADTVHIWKGLTYFVISVIMLFSAILMICFIFMRKRQKYGQYARLPEEPEKSCQN